MKKILALSTVLGAVILMASCAHKAPATFSTNAKTPEEKVAELKRNYTAEKMEQGMVIWKDNCAKCHKLFAPESEDVNEWENILPRMVHRAKLDDEQAALVRAYVLTNAKLH